MDTRKRLKEQTTIYKTPHGKTKCIVQDEPHLKAESELKCPGRIGSSC
jgi:hypothetical protein